MNYSPFMSILQREFTQGDCFNSVTLYFIHFIWHFNEGFEKSSISNTNLKREKPYFLSGTANTNRVPSPPLSARRVPLCSWAMTAAMLSPRPKPLFSPREASAR